jgi:hypothetical protein
VVIAFSNSRWEIGVAFTSPSISCATCEAAMTIARAFATAHHVDVWLSHDASFECVVGARSSRNAASGARTPSPATTTPSHATR